MVHPQSSSSPWLLQRIQGLTLLVLLTVSATATGFNFNPTAAKGLARTYGFLLGQETALERISRDLPELAGDAELARRQFSTTFPRALPKVEAMYRQAITDKAFAEHKATLLATLRNSFGTGRLSREQGQEFLRQMARRTKGDIESPILEYLLAVQYTDSPAREFTDGFRQRYETTGEGKSQGIRLRLQMPRSWAKKEGERPHIVQKWQSENGTGMEMVLLLIQDAQGVSPTKQEVDAFVRSGEVKEVLPEGATYVDAGIFTIEQQPGYWLRMAMPQERAGMAMHQETLQYQFFYRGKAIVLTCSAGALEKDKKQAEAAMTRMQPLCQQVVNSVLLLQAY